MQSLQNYVTVQAYIWKFRKQHDTGGGQGENTQSTLAASKVKRKMDVHVCVYNRARAALSSLDPNGEVSEQKMTMKWQE